MTTKTALPPEFVQLVQEVFALLGDKVSQEVKGDSATFLFSLLTSIRDKYPEGWVMLRTAVQHAAFQSNLEQARRKMGQG